VRDPDDPEKRFMVGEVLALQGLNDEAAGWWLSALRCDKLHQASHEALVTFYEARGDMEMAERHRQLANLSVPGTFRRGWKLIQVGDVVGAKKQRDLIAQIPEYYLEARLLSSTILSKEKKFDEAYALLTQALNHHELRPFALIAAGEALVGLNRPLEAEALLQEAVLEIPNAVEAHRLLSAIYYDLGAVNHAVFHLTRITELDPADFRPYRLLGLMNNDYEVYDVAISNYTEALKRDPDDTVRQEILLELSKCFIKQRDFPHAIETLQQAIPTADRDIMLAECLFNTGEVEEAVAQTDLVLRDSPKHLAAMLLRGDAYLLAGDGDNAAKIFQQAVTDNPYDYEARHKYAQALSRVGDEEESRAQLARGEELKQLRAYFTKLHEDAFERIDDAALRRELARVARELGHEDLAEVWIKAAEGLELRQTSAPAVRQNSDAPAPAEATAPSNP
jgi:tetratricopeptide (TPR) repeat protein